jgi:hypothetical protein
MAAPSGMGVAKGETGRVAIVRRSRREVRRLMGSGADRVVAGVEVRMSGVKAGQGGVRVKVRVYVGVKGGWIEEPLLPCSRDRVQ